MVSFNETLRLSDRCEFGLALVMVTFRVLGWYLGFGVWGLGLSD
jgi:hypothetical protein